MAGPVVTIMGPQGSGKGTQAKLLGERHGWVPLSSGELLRASSDPEVQAIMNRGELAPSELVNRVIGRAMVALDPGQGIILDGFPRMLDEAKWLEAELAKLDRSLTRVIMVNIDHEASVARLQSRGRTDDTLAGIEERLALYERETRPVVAYFAAKGLVREVNGIGSVEEVAKRVEETIG